MSYLNICYIDKLVSNLAPVSKRNWIYGSLSFLKFMNLGFKFFLKATINLLSFI